MSLMSEQTLCTDPFNQPMMAERRHGLRVRQIRPVKVFDPAAQRYIGGQTRDISPSGLRLELPAQTPLVAGRMLDVHMGLSTQGSLVVGRRNMIPARIIWIQRQPQGRPGKLLAGVQLMARPQSRQNAA